MQWVTVAVSTPAKTLRVHSYVPVHLDINSPLTSDIVKVYWLHYATKVNSAFYPSRVGNGVSACLVV